MLDSVCASNKDWLQSMFALCSIIPVKTSKIIVDMSIKKDTIKLTVVKEALSKIWRKLKMTKIIYSNIINA
ncbi:MAG: hypothetical protein HOL80_03045 [Candidatus Magasanikbacteria bacterium]|jgi:hypothetical protein|nr:hypothetical protein [Candidatus Magasanikbacteria bacterium]MBT5820377.1 hypothetical protein [Candidatus Magasanikbacteria bacterium]MBT6294778.1 hypothetical protein [Candidatus Magasanikbacteria bacterium]